MMHKYSIIIICLTFIVLPGYIFSQSNPSLNMMRGELDLRESTWDFHQDGILELNGEWGFVWHGFVHPSEIDYNNPSKEKGFIQVPSIWGEQNYNGKPLSNEGYGTYFARIILPKYEIGETFGLIMPNVATAYKLWINGKRVATNGVVGRSLEEMKAQNYPKSVFFTPQQNEIQIVLQVSNFVQRKGGLWDEIQLGYADQIVLKREKEIILQMMVTGSLFIMGIYHIGLFAFRRKEYSTLFFGLACLFICVRTLLVGNLLWFRIWPEFNWELAVKLEYLSVFIGIAFLGLYSYHLHTRDMNRKIAYTLFTIICLSCIPIIFLPARIYTHAMLAYQILMIFPLVYIGYIVLKAAFNSRKGAWINCLAMFIFILSVINDILYYNYIIHTGDMIGIGLLTFIFAQTLVMASRFSTAYTQVENLSFKLREVNRNLEQKVKERTKELEKVNGFLRDNITIDGLTKIRNRRYYEEKMAIHWEQSIRNQTPISLIMVDIDCFKLFNDYYGHQAGDKCLVQVAQELDKDIGDSGIVTRYGGEEFAIILPDTSLTKARRISERLRMIIESLKIPNDKSDVSPFVTVSIGLATTIAKNREEMESFIHRADKALYLSKSSGRNTIKFTS